MEAKALYGIGFIYSDLDEPSKALDFYKQALPLLKNRGDKEGEATTLTALMMLYSDPKFAERDLAKAALYGKQAVDLYQAIRAEMKGLEKSSQAAFLESVEDTYRTLADILTKQKRTAEAQQVLKLLKQ